MKPVPQTKMIFMDKEGEKEFSTAEAFEGEHAAQAEIDAQKKKE